jgi:hypothetical protein
MHSQWSISDWLLLQNYKKQDLVSKFTESGDVGRTRKSSYLAKEKQEGILYFVGREMLHNIAAIRFVQFQQSPH